jgi:hypothetical protein
VREADLLVEVVDPTQPMQSGESWSFPGPGLRVGSKGDLVKGTSLPPDLDLLCSARSGAGIGDVRQALRASLGLLPHSEAISPAPFLPRHRALLEQCLITSEPGSLGNLLGAWLQELPAP